jgi:hypothetical protein
MSSGALEKIVENWLTKTRERGFQTAYAQLLLNHGYKVIHLSPHTESELGKDIIAIAPDGVPCGFQLKIDKITTSRWRQEVWPECEQLLALPLVHPSLPSNRDHRSFLVTTGTLSDPVRNDIDQRNRQRRRKRQKPLYVVVRGQLARDLVASHSSILPWEPEDYRRFLELYVGDGTKPLRKLEFSAFLGSILLLPTAPKSRRDAQEHLSRALILSNYVIEPYRQAANHWAVAEAWTMTAAYLMWMAERHDLPDKLWRDTFLLAFGAVEAAVSDLLAGALESKHLTGAGLSDGVLHDWRVTVICGWLSSLGLASRLSGRVHPQEQAIVRFCLTNTTDLTLFCEELAPCWLNTILFLGATARSREADELLDRALYAILDANARNGPGVPNPYYGAEHVLRTTFGGDHPSLKGERIEEDFAGMSFVLETLVFLAAKGNLRQLVKKAWRPISHIMFSEFHPSPIWQSYLWRASEGERSDKHPQSEQSWSELKARAVSPTLAAIPILLQREPQIIPFFLLCYPHRLSPALVTYVGQRV